MSLVRVVLKSVFDEQGIKDAERAFAQVGKGIDNAFRVVAVASAAAGAAIGKFGLDSVRAASDLQESTNAVNVAFGDAAKSVLAIGETSAKSLGLARTEFNAAAVRFSAFSDRIVGEGGNVAGFIEEISTRAADFASVFNIDVSEALRVFQSGLAGEAEPLKRFGINLLQSEVNAFALANGIGEVGRELTETEKVQARYGLLLESTAKTAGDFANTSQDLANSQRILAANFKDLQAEVGQALLPVITELTAAFSAQLLPKMEELGAFLKSPQGQKAIEDMADAFERFFTFIFDNIGELADLAVQIAVTVTSLKVLKTALEVTTATMAFFNTTVGKNPFVIAATVILSLAGAVAILNIGAEKAETALEAVNMEARQLEQELKNLESQLLTTVDQEGVQRQINAIKDALEGVRREAHALNNETSLRRFRREIAATSGEANRFNNLLKGITAPTEAFVPFEVIDTPSSATSAPSAARTGKTAFEETQKIVKDAQKKFREATKRHNAAIVSARKSYDTSVFNAEKSYSDSLTSATVRRDESLADALKKHNENLSGIQRNFAAEQANIIRTSIDRLRDAFSRAVSANIADLFDTKKARESVKQIVQVFGKEIAIEVRGVEVGRSVDGLVMALRDRLTASRALLSNAAALASQGFSQTFIEQVVSAGLETGNELAKAILDATPETQGELKSLFNSLEKESETGMDSLAQTMFEQTGLATNELKRLFSQTQTDLVASLAQAETDYVVSQTSILKTFDDSMKAATNTRDEAFAAANTRLKEQLDTAAQAYKDSVTEIKDAFLEQIGALENGLGGLEGTVNKFIAAMDAAIKKATGATPTPTSPSAPVIGSLPAPRPATSGPVIQPLPGPTPARTTAAQNVININVKTDATQSPAMVGKVIAKEVNKFTGGGGGLRGISVVAL